MKTNSIPKYRKYILFLLLFLFVFVISCDKKSNIDSYSNFSNVLSDDTTQNTTSASSSVSSDETTPDAKRFFNNVSEYQISQGSENSTGMIAGIVLNGKYYEGQEHKYEWVEFKKDYYLPINDNRQFVRSLDEIPEGCPIVKITQNDTLELFSNEKPMHGYYFYNMEKGYESFTDIPTVPGMYWLVAYTESDILPWAAEDFVAPDELTEYALSYQYIFAVVVE